MTEPGNQPNPDPPRPVPQPVSQPAGEQAADAPRTGPTPQPRSLVCPFCGEITRSLKRCDVCSGRFDPLSRQATQNAMGPWWVRGIGSPRSPGCSYKVVRTMIERGTIKRESVIRGPTTRQFWMLAAKTPGVAHLLGACHSCGTETTQSGGVCGSCGAVFDVETDRQWLGLGPIRDLPGQASMAEEGVARPAHQFMAGVAAGAGSDDPRGGPVVGAVVEAGQHGDGEASRAGWLVPSLVAASLTLVVGLLVGAGVMWASLGGAVAGDGPQEQATTREPPPEGPVVARRQSTRGQPGGTPASGADPWGVAPSPDDEQTTADGAEIAAANEQAETDAVSASAAEIKLIEALIAEGTWAALTEAEAALDASSDVPEGTRARLRGIVRERLDALAMRELP